MRAFATSSVKAVILVQRWVTPGAVALVTAISGISAVPSTAFTTPATEPLRIQCARILRMHRRIINWLPSRLTLGSRVVVDITVANSSNRPPKVVMVFGVEHRDQRLVEPNRHQR